MCHQGQLHPQRWVSAWGTPAPPPRGLVEPALLSRLNGNGSYQAKRWGPTQES